MIKFIHRDCLEDDFHSSVSSGRLRVLQNDTHTHIAFLIIIHNFSRAHIVENKK